MKRSLITIYKEYAIILFSIVLVTFYFLHQSLPNRSDEYFVAKKDHAEAKKERTKINLEIINSIKGSALHKKFEEQNLKTNALWKKYLIEKKRQKVFGFKSFKIFFESFWYTSVFFMFILFVFVKSLYVDYKNKSFKFICGLALSIVMFKYYWIFQQFNDLNEVSYLLMCLLTAYLIIVAISLMVKQRKRYVDEVKEDMLDIAKKALLNSRPEKREEMLDFIDKLSKK